jgi:hypothetical protein
MESITIMKVFKKFKAKAKSNFRDLMIQEWMLFENFKTEEDALNNYGGVDFDNLCERVKNECLYVPDIGYSDKTVDGTLCFEEKDNSFVIPVEFLENVREIE